MGFQASVFNAEIEFCKKFKNMQELLTWCYTQQFTPKMTGMLLDGYEVAGYSVRYIEKTTPQKQDMIKASEKKSLIRELLGSVFGE